MLNLIRQRKKFSWWVGIFVVAGFLLSAVGQYGHAFDEGDHGHVSSIVQIHDNLEIPQDDGSDHEPVKSSEKTLDHDCAVIACMAMLLPTEVLNSVSDPMSDWNLRNSLQHKLQAVKPPYHPPISS
jgi:hypothetical protein